MAVRLDPEDIFEAIRRSKPGLPAVPAGAGVPTVPTLPPMGGGAPRIDREGMARAIAASGGRAAQQGAQQSGGGGFGGFIGKALGVIDMPRSIITSGVKEIKDAFDGEGFSWGDFTQQARNHYGFGDFLHDENIDLGKWGNRAVGLAGDILLDPLSWAGGVGAFARARGARGLVDDLTPLVKDLGEMGVRDATQQATLRAAQDAVVAAGSKGGSISRARNVLARQHGEVGKKLIDDLGIETGLRFRLPGTGPVLGRLTRDSAGIARKRASQIPRLVQERMKKVLGQDADLGDLVLKAQKRETLDQIPDDLRQILQRAANVPVDVVPFGVFPISSGVTASIMASPGIGWEKVASSRFGNTFREFFVDPQKKYLDTLARGRGATDEDIAFKQKSRDRKKMANTLLRTKDPDKIILGNFMRQSYNRGSMTSGYWTDSAMRRRKVFMNEVQQNVGRVDDETLGRLTDLSPELVDDFADGVVSPQVMDAVRGRFPGLSDENIMFVVRRYDELIRTPDAEFLARPDLYGSEGQLVNDMNDVLVEFGGYTPEIWTPQGLEIVKNAHGGDLPPWIEGVSREFEEVLPEARTMDEVRQRATSGRVRRRNMRPMATRADGTFAGGTELNISRADGSGRVRRMLRRSNPQRTDVQQRVVGQGPDGRSTVIRRDLTPDELATRGRRPARELTTEPEGLSIPEQIEAAYREAGWLDEGESLFVRGFEARENAHINSLASDIRLRSIESYAASQGLIYNADTYRTLGRELGDLEQAVVDGNAVLRQLTDSEAAAQAVVDAITAQGAAARAQTIENLEAWVARHGGDAPEMDARVKELTNMLVDGRVESKLLVDEVSTIVRDLQDMLGYRRVATRTRVPGPEDMPFEDLIAAPPGANPVAFAIDAIRQLTPILEDLDSVMARASLLTEGIAKYAKLSRDIRNLDTVPSGSGLVINNVPSTVPADQATFLTGLDGLSNDIQESIRFLETDLLPFAQSLTDSAMLHDQTVQAAQALRDASQMSAGTQNIDVQDLFNQTNDALKAMDFEGGGPDFLHTFSRGPDGQLANPIDEKRLPPATPGGELRSTADVIMEGYSGSDAAVQRGTKIINTLRLTQELHRDVATKVAAKTGETVDEVVRWLPFEHVMGVTAAFSNNQFDVTFTVFGQFNRADTAFIPARLGGTGHAIEINDLHTKISNVMGSYMDSMVLYEADRLGVNVRAGSIMVGGPSREVMINRRIFGRSDGAGSWTAGGGSNGLYKPFEAWRLPDADGNLQTIWKSTGLSPESKTFIDSAEALYKANPSRGGESVRDLIASGELALPPAGPYRDAIEEMLNVQPLLGGGGGNTTLMDWGQEIPEMVKGFKGDYDRHYFYGMAGLTRRDYSGNFAGSLDLDSYYGLKLTADADANLGVGGAVRAEDIVQGPWRSGDSAVRSPTTPGELRGNQGRIFRVKDGKAVPKVLGFGEESGMRIGPTPLSAAAGDVTAKRVALLTEMGDLENVLNVNYLSNLLPDNLKSTLRGQSGASTSLTGLPDFVSGDTARTLAQKAKTRREALAATAEQTWGTEGIERYMPFLRSEPFPAPNSLVGESAAIRRTEHWQLPEMRARLNDLQESLEDQISGRSAALADDAEVWVGGVSTDAGTLRDFANGIDSIDASVVYNDMIATVDAALNKMAYVADAGASQAANAGDSVRSNLLNEFWDAFQGYVTNFSASPGDMFWHLEAAGLSDDVWKAVVDEFMKKGSLSAAANHMDFYAASLFSDSIKSQSILGVGFPEEAIDGYARMLAGDTVWNPASMAAGGEAFTPGVPQEIADVLYDALDTGVGFRSNEYWDAIQSVMDNWGVGNGGFERGELIEWGYLVQQYDNLSGAKYNQASFMAEERLYGAFDNARDDTLNEITRLENEIANFDSAAQDAAQGRLDARRRTLAKKELIVQNIKKQRLDMEDVVNKAEQERNNLANKIGNMLGPANGRPFNVNSFGGQVDLSNVTSTQLQDLFNSGGKQMWGSGAMDEWLVAGSAEYADEFTYAMLAAQKMDDRAEVGRFLKGYDKAHNWLKAQMVATPGFVARNVFGGMANMWFADIPLTEVPRTFALLKKAYSAGNGDLAAGFRKLVADNPTNIEYANALELVQLGVHGGGQAASVVDVNLGRSSRTDWVWGSKENSKYSGRIRMNPMDAGFFMFAGVRHANTFAEEAMRLGTALHARRVGGSIDDALDLTYKLHFNYGGLSEAERKFGKRAFPFYTWTRNNLPLQMQFLANSPGKFNRLMSLRRNVELGEEREGVVPDYFMQGFGMQLPFSIGSAQAYSQPDLPLQDLFKFDPTQRGYGKVMEQIFSSTTPVLKTPIEYWAGKRVFEGIPFREEYVPVPAATRMIPGLMQAAQVLGWAKKNSKDEWMMYDNRLAVLDNMMPFIGRLRRIIPEDEKTQSRWIQSVMSMFGGVSLRLNTPREQRNERVRQRVEREMTRQDRLDLERPRK